MGALASACNQTAPDPNTETSMETTDAANTVDESKESAMVSFAQKDERPSMYLNIMILKKPDQETITPVIETKIQNVPILGHFSLFRRYGAKVAYKAITEDKIAAKLAIEMPSRMPEKMKEMGIDAEVEEVFTLGAFVVLRLVIVHVELPKLLAAKLDADKAEKATKVLGGIRSFAGKLGLEEKLLERRDKVLGGKIVEKLCEILPQKLPEKMAEKGMEVEVVTRAEAEEALFFFQIHKSLTELKSH